MNHQYSSILSCQSLKLTCFPRMTMTFQEVKPYSHVFKQILKWFRFGEFDLRKDKLLLQVKTLDKLFEYYSLVQLLKMLIQQGFDATPNKPPAYSYKYQTSDALYENEHDIANTYHLQKDDWNITLYYQPVIRSYGSENEISLFRVSMINDYCTPDFLLKINKKALLPLYVVMDSKFSSRATIKRHYLEKAVRQYFCLLSSNDRAYISVGMVSLLQGRVDESPILFKYTSMPLAQRVSIGIVSFNTGSSSLLRLWNEINSVVEKFLIAHQPTAIRDLEKPKSEFYSVANIPSSFDRTSEEREADN